ncbi:M23 family metallopeptidase [Porifericola rhodea]|uniref:M23 family metallopeptidase n=1 Tax=Porifericola rhodea TaxID=930972 RepID=UPI002665552F|nr:M23 family metallopeptidase [Porifericola rhodea]WKN31735.1 M23 family metallopeptidase [Porifericola rhodea]
MKLNKLTLLLALLLTSTVFVSTTLEDDYYVFPINPGKRNYLSGNFCELRSSHMHAGLDIKVGGVVGAPVHAAAEGYVSRIKISWGGYGNALYLQHPNGTTTVYAHLDQFNDKIAEYVREAQYQQKTFDIELFPDKEDLQVKRGEIIGKAGNSGSSGGPHLHFEIRGANQVPMDPLQFNFSEIVDNLAPYVRKVALVTLDKDARINGQFGRFEFPVRSNGNQYEVSENIRVHGKVGIELAAYDRADGVRNIYGVTSTEMSFDGEPYFSYLTDKLAFGYAKNIHVFTNYEERYRQDRTFYKLYVDDGNTLPLYKSLKNKGKLNIQDNEQHRVDVKLIDHYGNSSSLRLSLKGSAPQPEANFKVRYFSKPYNQQNYHVRGNTLQLFAPADKDPEGVYERKLAKFFANRMGYEEAPAYVVNDMAIYLWDLRRGMPDSVDLCGSTQKFPLKMKVPAYNAFSFYQPEMDIYFSKSTLFDTLYLTTDYQVDADREIFTIHEDHTPLKSSIKVKLKPKMLPPGPKKKTSVYRLTTSGDLSYEGGEWSGNTISFSTRSFGDYVLAADTLSPVVTPINVNNRQLKFKIEDQMSGIKNYQMYVNGKWVLMRYDYKWDVIWTESDDDRAELSGEYKLLVEDNAGNEKVFEGKI